jgi:peptidoglycan/LPS O-acetylase OafA/YrhL
VLFGASFAFLAIALAAHPTRLLVNPAMRKVGKISFSLYIIHFVVIYVFENMLFRDGFLLNGNAGFIAALMLIMFTSCLLSLITYRYIERPGIAFGKFLIDRLNKSITY